MFSDPIKNLNQLGIRENMIIADLGAGTGFYSIAAAKLVPNGKVYSVEIQKDFLNTIRNKAADLNLNNLECFLGDLEKKGGSKIKDEIIDVVLVSNILFQIENKSRFIEEIKRILKNKGKVLVVDWEKETSLLGAKLENALPKKETINLFLEKGFKLEKEIEAGEHHYGIVFIKE